MIPAAAPVSSRVPLPPPPSSSSVSSSCFAFAVVALTPPPSPPMREKMADSLPFLFLATVASCRQRNADAEEVNVFSNGFIQLLLKELPVSPQYVFPGNFRSISLGLTRIFGYI